MNPEEVRIYNRVFYKNEIKLILSIDGDNPCINTFESIHISDYVKWEELQPVPLTTVFLVEEGFDQYLHLLNPQIQFYTKNGFTLEVHINQRIGYQLQHSTIEIKYVHQLQNLYYSITQTELRL